MCFGYGHKIVKIVKKIQKRLIKNLQNAKSVVYLYQIQDKEEYTDRRIKWHLSIIKH